MGANLYCLFCLYNKILKKFAPKGAQKVHFCSVCPSSRRSSMPDFNSEEHSLIYECIPQNTRNAHTICVYSSYFHFSCHTEWAEGEIIIKPQSITLTHKISETAQSPNSPFPFWNWLFRFGDLVFGLGHGLVEKSKLHKCTVYFLFRDEAYYSRKYSISAFAQKNITDRRMSLSTLTPVSR